MASVVFFFGLSSVCHQVRADQTSILVAELVSLMDFIEKILNAWLKRFLKHSLKSIFSMSYILCTNVSLEMDTCGYLKAMDNHLMEQH